MYQTKCTATSLTPTYSMGTLLSQVLRDYNFFLYIRVRDLILESVLNLPYLIH